MSMFLPGVFFSKPTVLEIFVYVSHGGAQNFCAVLRLNPIHGPAF
jgi:hypothetical protein